MIHGADELVTASQNAIDSPKIPPEVKPVFQDIKATIVGLKPCLDKPNVQCIRNAFQNKIGRAMVKGASKSKQPLQLLFIRMLQEERFMYAFLENPSGEEAVRIAKATFKANAVAINQFLRKK